MKLKISTLFHWLYATLMFLPILMFIPSCLYYGFNEHATNTETTTINYKYESNEVNSLNDLVEGNIYYFDWSLGLDIYNDNLNGLDFTFSVYKGDIEFEFYNSYDIMQWFDYDENTPLTFKVQNEQLFWYYYQDYELTYFYLQNITISIDSNLSNFKNYATNQNLNYFSYTDYNVIESVSVNTDDTITDKVATAWERTWDLPLFAWTQNSFVAAPFSYITGLFGLSSDNSINYVFTYFVSISICWLVFDLIMYVPNLAHRWLDRSAIE